MPRVSVPPAPRFRRLREGCGAKYQGGKRRQDELSHRFTYSMFISYSHNDEESRFTPFNHKFLLGRDRDCLSRPVW
jgi:hypothetical protein